MCITVEALTANGIVEVRPALAELLQDAVRSGTSIGFLPPLTEADTEDEA